MKNLCGTCKWARWDDEGFHCDGGADSDSWTWTWVKVTGPKNTNIDNLMDKCSKWRKVL